MTEYIGMLGACIGLVVSFYIHSQKKNNTDLICPREVHCDRVVGSAYAATFSIPNELLGIAFYAIAGILHAIVFVWPLLMTPLVAWTLVILTTGAVIFSLYFIVLQAFVIKAWCLWCLGSTLATTLLVIALGVQGAPVLSILLGVVAGQGGINLV